MMRKIVVTTTGVREVVNITAKIEQMLLQHPAKDGFITLFLRHSSAALTTAYLGDEIKLFGSVDLISAPSSTEHGHTHHLGQIPAYVLASFLGPNLSVPVEGNHLLLGTFQCIVLVEFNGPRMREIMVGYEKQTKPNIENLPSPPHNFGLRHRRVP